MLFKAVTLFLVFMAVIAMFGKLHWVGGKRLTQTKCRQCGRYRIGKVQRACGKKGCPNG